MQMRTRGTTGGTMKLKVTEANGCGNRFVIVDKLDEAVTGSQGAMSVAIGKRFLTDSILLLTRSDQADARMRILEKDGTESDMCGNGIRCIARYLMDSHGFDNPLDIETNTGVRTVTRVDRTNFTVEMGVSVASEKVWDTPISVGTKTYNIFLVNSGEPHAIVFVDELTEVDVARIGRTIRNRFDQGGANADFVHVVDPGTIAIRTYERGVEAETLACGTGATASVVAAVESGRMKGGRVRVKCSGGDLYVTYRNNEAVLEGPAELSKTQEISL